MSPRNAFHARSRENLDGRMERGYNFLSWYIKSKRDMCNDAKGYVRCC